MDKPTKQTKREKEKLRKEKDRERKALERERLRSERSSDIQSDSDASSQSGQAGPTESATATPGVTPGHIGGRRRTYSEMSLCASSSDAELMRPPPPKVFIDRRAEFRKKEAEKASVELTVEQMVRKLDDSMKSLGTIGEQPIDILIGQANKCLAINREVAARSGSLKGGYVKGLNSTTKFIGVILEALASRTPASEVAALQAENARLRSEVKGLRSAVEMLRQEMARGREPVALSPPSPTPAPRRASPVLQRETPLSQEDLARSIMVQVGTMVNARLEDLKRRLPPEERVAPPLAARQRVAALAAPPLPHPQQSVRPQPVSALSGQQTQAKGKGRSKKKPATAGPQKPAPRPLPPAPKAMTESWSSVAKRGAKPAPKAAPRQAPKSIPDEGWTSVGKRGGKRPGKAVSAGPKQPKLQAPRSSAVVITLQPGAEEKGITYADVLRQAKRDIDLSTLGITEGLRSRKSATGACMLELAGTTSGEKADSLAARLREVLDPEAVKVTRPEKTAELRISGLDDSIVPEDISAALASCTGCSVEAVHVGQVRSSFRGVGTAFVRCPVTAAKQLVARGRRLLVGWVSAQVTVLERRPMRCYRCLHTGHVRVKCECEVDRSDVCYRCGHTGHKAAACPANAPNCPLCAAAGKSAGHRMGGKDCRPPKPKKIVRGAAANISAAPAAEEAMETTGP